jgi:hypothetical protein
MAKRGGGIVLTRDDAGNIHRMLAFHLRGLKFFNPIDAFETERATEQAMLRLARKLRDTEKGAKS